MRYADQVGQRRMPREGAASKLRRGLAAWLAQRTARRFGAVPAQNAERPARMIGLMDHMGAGNLGDDTTQTAVLQNIRKRWPDAVVCAFTMNPPDTEARHGIRAYPLRRRTWARPGEALDAAADAAAGPAEPQRRPVARWFRRAAAKLTAKPAALAAETAFLWRSYAAVRQLDMFVLSGSGQLLDSWGGPWEYPFTICKWVLLAKLAGVRCCFLNVGTGPVQHRLSKVFIRQALRMADYAAFRDAPSLALMRRIGFAGSAEVSHDSVYCYDHATASGRPGAAPGALPVVGLAPMAYCDPRRYCVRDGAAYQEFVARFAAFGARLSRHHRVTVFSTDIWFDADTLDEVGVRLAGDPAAVGQNILAAGPIGSVQTLLAQMSGMDYLVTCRFHGVIFAHLLNIPVVALSHHPKVTTLMADLGLADYCLDIDTFEVATLQATFDRMVADSARIKRRLAETAIAYRQQLTQQFDRLFPPAAG